MVEIKKLNDGHNIPMIGFGTWLIEEGEVAYQAVKDAIEVGYRHIDTAHIYGNENSVGSAIKDSGIAREDIFLTTKVWNDVTTEEETIRAVKESLVKLKTDYADLVLIHWPNPVNVRGEGEGWIERNRAVWRGLETLKAEGLIRSIGVSNFMVHHLKSLTETANIIPAVNQISLAPGLTQDEVVSFCNQENILVEAYSPLGHGTAFNHPVIQEVAGHYPDKTPAQVTLRWSLDKGFLPLPKSVTPKHIASNLAIFDFKLTPEDISLLDKVEGVSEYRDPDQTKH